MDKTNEVNDQQLLKQTPISHAMPTAALSTAILGKTIAIGKLENYAIRIYSNCGIATYNI